MRATRPTVRSPSPTFNPERVPAAGVDEVDGIVSRVEIAVALAQVTDLVEWVLLGPAAERRVVVALAEVVQAAGHEIAAGEAEGCVEV